MAVSGDVYTAKAVIAARTPGAGGVGDGAGIMFAEGLYRNALKMIGTPRPPAATADDDDAAAGGAARADLRLARGRSGNLKGANLMTWTCRRGWWCPWAFSCAA